MNKNHLKILIISLAIFTSPTLLVWQAAPFKSLKEDKNVSKNILVHAKSVENIRLDVPLINQNPELINGCEITSLTMLLNYKGVNVDKMTLASEMPKDPTPMRRSSDGRIISWGNPSVGFVGDVTGKSGPGYSINPNALMPLTNKYSNNTAIDLTNTSIEDIEASLIAGSPVIAWVNVYMNITSTKREWKDGSLNKVVAPFKQHAVLLTGFDNEYFYFNDPLAVIKDAMVSRDKFEAVWIFCGKYALTVR